MYKEMSSLYLIDNENILILEAENLFEPKKDVDRYGKAIERIYRDMPDLKGGY